MVINPKVNLRGKKERKETRAPRAIREAKVPKVGLKEKITKRKKPKNAINKTGGLAKHQNRSRQD